MKRAALFNIPELKENHRGVEDLLPTTIEEFLNYLPDLIDEFETSLTAEDQERRIRAAHSLKGALASVCSSELKGVAQQMEDLAKSPSLEDLKDIWIELKPQLKILSDQLQHYRRELA